MNIGQLHCDEIQKDDVYRPLHRSGVATAPPGTKDAILDLDVTGQFDYDRRRDHRIDDYVGKLVIEWGSAPLAWVQLAASKPKPVTELANQQDPPFPGFGRFHSNVDTLSELPSGWLEVLRSVKGVYLLVDEETGSQYVGSAKGQDSLLGRWTAYANGGDDGDLGLRAAGKRRYQVSVLEVVGTTTPDDTIETIESNWKRKLLSR